MNRSFPCTMRVIAALCTVALPAALSYGVEVSNYSSHVQNGNVITITCSSGSQKVRITVCTPSIVKVDFDARGTFASTQDLLSADFAAKVWSPAPSPTVTDKGATLEIQTGQILVSVQKTPIRIKYYNGSGVLITGDTDSRGMSVGAGVTPWVQFTKQASEHFFGWGMTYEFYRGSFSTCDKTGTTCDIRSSAAPFMFSTGGYGVFCLFAIPDPGKSTNGYVGSWSGNNKGPGYDLRTNAAFWAETDYPMDYLSYYFIAGPGYRQVINGYTQVSGRFPKLGKKFYGIGRDIYLMEGVTPNDFKSIADSWRNGRFPIDNIRNDQFFDWGQFGQPTPGGLSWDANLPAAVAYVKSKGFTVGGMMRGYGYDGCCGSNSANFAPVQDSAHAKTSVDHGFDFAWYDAIGYIPRSKAKHMWDVWKYAHGGDETKTWIARGWMSMSSQSFPAGHTGDDLQTMGAWKVVPATLEEHIVGYAVSYTDLGEGLDWNYIGTALRPVASFHQSGAAGGLRDKDFKVWTFPADLQACIRKWQGLHYRFIPYLFTYGMIANQTGMPVWRHMMCHDPGDAQTYNKDRQAYVGDDIIISPYYPDGDNNSGSRNGIYLPAGTWYDYFEGTKYTGPTTINYQCDPGTGVANKKLPMFARAGAIVPLMDTLQYIGEKPETLLTVCAWPSGTTQFTLYEDETPVTTAFQCIQSGTQTDVVIGAFRGSAYCPDASRRRYAIELHGSTAPQTVVSAGQVLTKQATKAALDAAVSGWFFDAAKGGVTYAKATGNAVAGFTVTVCQGGQCSPVNSVAQRTPPVEGAIRVNARQRRIDVFVAGEYLLEMVDMSGRVVASAAESGSARLVIPEGARGLYYLRAVSATRTWSAHVVLR